MMHFFVEVTSFGCRNNLGSHFYTLEFAPDNKPKIAYATSFGVSQIPNSQKRGYRKNI